MKSVIVHKFCEHSGKYNTSCVTLSYNTLLVMVVLIIITVVVVPVGSYTSDLMSIFARYFLFS